MATKKELEDRIAELEEERSRRDHPTNIQISQTGLSDAQRDGLRAAMLSAPAFHRTQAPELWGMLEGLVK